MKRLGHAILLGTLLVTACAQRASMSGPAPLAGEPAPIDTLSMRADTRVLAHDSLGGRGTGSEGVRGAARYIARRLETLGLRPLRGAGIDAYLDSVPLLRVDVSRATIAIDGAPARAHGEGFVLGRFGREGMHAASAPIARIGSDSAAVTAGTWLLLDGSLGEAAARWLPRWRSSGVTGLVVRLNADAAIPAYHAQLGNTRWQLAEGGPEPVWQADLPIVMVGPALADSLLAPGARLSFEPNPSVERIVDFNVVAVLETPANAQRDAVVLTAHYDHLGTMGGVRGDSIFNGFSDNAAGVAMLLAIARSASDAPPERPLVFLFPAAEEVGLLGSIHFVRTHSDLVARTHALLNLDAGAPPAPPTRWRLAAGTRSWAGAVAAAAVEAQGWAHRSDPGSPNSDHWPFVAVGIPAVFLIPDGAYENVDEEGTRRLTERWDRYHQPNDEWAAEFPFSGLARYASLGLRIAYALAAAPDQ